tara:strand:- start:6149 stop:6307 length:159 start_codon:yes stop_codon:yes gene_type:complete
MNEISHDTLRLRGNMLWMVLAVIYALNLCLLGYMWITLEGMVVAARSSPWHR